MLETSLHLRGMRVLEVVEDSVGTLMLRVAAEGRWSVCPGCGAVCGRVRGYRPQRVRDLPTRGQETVLVWARRRFECEGCGRTHVERHADIAGRFTERMARRLVSDARVMSIRRVAEGAGVSWSTIMGLVRTAAEREAARRQRRRCRVLLIDETSVQRRHRYVTVLADGETNRTLAMLPGRSKAALARFFRNQGPAWRRGVEVVVTDGAAPYKAAVDQYLPRAQHVLDRFHVIRWFGTALVQLRRDLQRRSRGRPGWEPSLHRSRYLMLKRQDRLTDPEREQLRRLFDAYPLMETGWRALQLLHQVYQAPNLQEACRALDRFTDLYQTGRIPQYRKTVNAILRWSDEILAYHTTGRPTNGPIEATNNLLQKLKRTAHGFTNPQNYAHRGILLT